MKCSFKPVFIGWSTLVLQLPFQLFFTIWVGGFFGGLAAMLFPDARLSYIIFGGLAFFGIPFIAYFGKRMNDSRTEYKFSALIALAVDLVQSGIGIED